MKIGRAGLNLIKYYEQLRLAAYLPTPEDVWTIGYGHTKGVMYGLTCIEEQALAWLMEDCAEAETAVNEIGVPLSQNKFDALVSFVFNVGTTAFEKSTIRRLLKDGDYDGAANEFKRWNKQKGKVLNGLTARRKKEEELFRHGF